jgi:hypothetical protein
MDPILSATTPDASKHSMDLFREACGGGLLQLNISYEGRQDTALRVLEQPYALVGRDPRADLILDHSEVDLRHAYLQRVDGHVYCFDLGSRSGTHWETGKGTSGWVDYKHGVRIGPHCIRPERIIHKENVDPGAMNKGWSSLPEVTFELIRQGQATQWKMVPIVALVGRSEECRVRLVGSGVSSFHCSLVRTPSGVWVVNLFDGGIRVNGASVRCIRLGENDELQVGSFLMRLHYDTAPQSSELPPPPTQNPVDPNCGAGNPSQEIVALAMADRSAECEELRAQLALLQNRAGRTEELRAVLTAQQGLIAQLQVKLSELQTAKKDDDTRRVRETELARLREERAWWKEEFGRLRQELEASTIHSELLTRSASVLENVQAEHKRLREASEAAWRETEELRVHIRDLERVLANASNSRADKGGARASRCRASDPASALGVETSSMSSRVALVDNVL